MEFIEDYIGKEFTIIIGLDQQEFFNSVNDLIVKNVNDGFQIGSDVFEYYVKYFNGNKTDTDNDNVPIVGSCTLKNIGNTCYLNAALQYLYSIKEIRDYFKNNVIPFDPNKRNHYNILIELQKIINAMSNHKTPEIPIDLSNINHENLHEILIKNIIIADPIKGFNLTAQHDSIDFLQTIFNSFFECGIKEISNLYHHTLQSIVTCEYSNNQLKKLDPQNVFTLYIIPELNNIQDYINNYQKRESLKYSDKPEQNESHEICPTRSNSEQVKEEVLKNKDYVIPPSGPDGKSLRGQSYRTSTIKLNDSTKYILMNIQRLEIVDIVLDQKIKKEYMLKLMNKIFRESISH
jgi:ubiquitin C-terminal hydrolase